MLNMPLLSALNPPSESNADMLGFEAVTGGM
jgi:hypothetical protein